MALTTAYRTAPFSSISLNMLSRLRALVEGGKIRCGGLCVYINDAWCRDAVVVCKHCSTPGGVYDYKCRPFYLPREYTAILLVAVYIPPSSNNNRSEALNDLYQHISEQQTAHPDAFLILAGDFNHADLKSVFPKTPTHRLSNKGKKHSGLCLHHPERSLQGPPPPPPRSLRPHHCHANACIQTAR